jgi:hypothetical protein
VAAALMGSGREGSEGRVGGRVGREGVLGAVAGEDVDWGFDNDVPELQSRVKIS